MKEDTLTDMVLAMKDNVGLVHQMPYTCDGAGLPSTLEKVGRHNTDRFVADESDMNHTTDIVPY